MGQHRSLRFLLRPDDDVMDMLESYMRLAGLTRTAAINNALRIGLWAIAAKHGAAEKENDTERKKAPETT